MKNNINNIINNNNDNILNKNNRSKLSLFNNLNIDKNLEKYRNKKPKVLFEDLKSKMIINNDNKVEKNIINNNILFNNNLANGNIKQINNNNFGPDKSSLKRKK